MRTPRRRSSCGTRAPRASSTSRRRWATTCTRCSTTSSRSTRTATRSSCSARVCRSLSRRVRPRQLQLEAKMATVSQLAGRTTAATERHRPSFLTSRRASGRSLPFSSGVWAPRMGHLLCRALNSSLISFDFKYNTVPDIRVLHAVAKFQSSSCFFLLFILSPHTIVPFYSNYSNHSTSTVFSFRTHYLYSNFPSKIMFFFIPFLDNIMIVYIIYVQPIVEYFNTCSSIHSLN